MKKIIHCFAGLLLIACSDLPLHAQIIGNGQTLTESFRMENIDRINIELDAIIEIDGQQGQTEAIDISMDENLFAYLIIKRDHKGISLGFREAVKTSRPIMIRIDAPGLERLDPGLDNTSYIRNLVVPEFQLQALSGKASLSGTVGTLRLMSERGHIDASEMLATNAVVNVWQEGKASLRVANKIEAWASGNSRVFLVNEPQKLIRHEKGEAQIILPSDQGSAVDHPKAYVSLSLQNNGQRFLNTFVKGPSGQRFSYGLPFKVGQMRAERFPVGTRIYAGNDAVFGRLLYEVTSQDEGKTISLLAE